MKFTGTIINAALVIVVGLGHAPLVRAWDVDLRCPQPPYYKRELLQEQDDAWLAALATASTVTDEKMDGKSLRGGSANRDLEIISVFSLKMYWEEGYCWQEEYSRHRKWCWECQGGCKEDGILWWQTCTDVQDQKFSYLPHPQGGRFKTAYHDLCLQRTTTTQYVLKKCSDNKAQIILGLRTDGQPFELTPLGDFEQCINQAHHPKAGEIVENTTCQIARKWSTNLMELYEADSDHDTDLDDQLRLRADDCSKSNPCDRCQGDCDQDADCRGTNLMCFQRGGKNKDAPVPGCIGDALTNRDYCIYKNLAPAPTRAPALPTNNPPINSPVQSIPLVTKVRNCSPTKPCDRCEGDCDTDQDCKSGLECFQKSGLDAVPGCAGQDSSPNDFCFRP